MLVHMCVLLNHSHKPNPHIASTKLSTAIKIIRVVETHVLFTDLLKNVEMIAKFSLHFFPLEHEFLGSQSQKLFACHWASEFWDASEVGFRAG